MVNYGSVSIGHVKSQNDLKTLIKSIPKSDVYLIKPNWYSPLPGGFTRANILEMLITALPKPSIIVEGHSLDRQDGTTQYYVQGSKVDWRWIMKNPNWGWMIETKAIDEMRRQEKLFLDKYDFTRVFEKHNVEYINITEEIWAKRIEDPESVRETIKNESDPFLREKIFGFMPTKLAKLKGNTLISLGRVKGYGGNYPSLSIKNLFGLIPDPMRSWWHGSDNCDLSQNIIDVTRLYNAYFKLFGICEAIENFTVNDPRGEVKAPFGVYRVQPGKGFLACSANLVELDAILCCLMNIDPEKVGYIQNGGVLGKYDKSVLEKASSSSPLFLNPNERKMN